MVAYAVYAGLSLLIVQAGSIEQARREAIDIHGVGHKPYLARDWKIHLASQEEIDLYAAYADNLAPSMPTAKVAKTKPKDTRARLL